MSKPNEIMGLVFVASFDASAQTTAGIMANAWAVPGQPAKARRSRSLKSRENPAPSSTSVANLEGAGLAVD